MPFFRASNKLVYFAHVPECGGSAVEHYLRQRFGALGFTDEHFFSLPASLQWSRSSPQHVTVSALERLFPPGLFDASFAVVRHPVDRMVSEFHHQRDHLLRVDPSKSFSSWVAQLDRGIAATPWLYDNHLRPMTDIVPFGATVFRLEDGLDQVVSYLDELVGARAETIRMKRLFVRDTSIPKVVPSEYDIATIERIFARDFERFGYDRNNPSSISRASPRLRQSQIPTEPIQRQDRSDHAARFRSMGVNSFLAGDVVNAHASLRFALNCAPHDTQSHALIANTYLRLGALNLATDHAERALRHQPDNRDALVALAGARLRLKDPRAREAVEALALYPELGDFPKLLRIALQMMENEDELEATLFDLAEYLETHYEDVLAGELFAETFGAFSEAGDKDRLREFLEGVGIKADQADLTPLPKPAVGQEAIVDIIIPVYNAISDLDLCLKSIRKFPSLAMRHIILVDDCSTPQSAAWLIDYQERHADVRLFRNQENLGFTRAVMAGVAQSSAPYMLFLNSDTQVTAHWLDYMLEAMQAGPLTALVGPLSNNGFYQTIRPSHAAGRKPLIELSPDQIAAQVLTITQRAFPRVPFLSGFCLLAHRAAFDLAGGLDCEAFPHGYWEVQDLCLKLIDLGFDSVIADNSYVHHFGGGSIQSQRKKDLSAKGRNLMFTRYSALRVLMAEVVSSREPEVARHRHAWSERDLHSAFANMEASALSSVQLARAVQQACLKEPPASVVGKEVCFFVTHCPLGAPSEYTLTYIEALKQAGLLVIVCLAAEDLAIPVADPIMDLADGVLIRENRGYDFGAWADLLRRFPRCWDAERLYFVNDSILGPFQSLDPIISSIRDRNAGFFALSEVTSSNSYHAQSFFFGWNKQNLESIELRKYWDDVINFVDKGKVIFHYEFSIAQLSQDLPDGSQHIAFGFQEIFGVAQSEISLFNTSHSGWKRLLHVGFPFVKTDLLRDGVLNVDTANWEAFCAFHGADVGSMKRSIEASRLNRLSYRFQSGEP
jgi:GT2 family glycosyltransferase